MVALQYCVSFMCTGKWFGSNSCISIDFLTLISHSFLSNKKLSKDTEKKKKVANQNFWKYHHASCIKINTF